MKKKIILSLFTLFIIPFTVNAKSYQIYDVLKEEAESNGLARQYTGQHHDSFDEDPTYDIYHWYATSLNQGAEVRNKNNVIFAGKCWQMMRTTDTGGVKLIYNGVAENDQCLDTRPNHPGYTDRSFLSLSGNLYYGTSYTFNEETSMFSLAGDIVQSEWTNETNTGLVGKYTCRSSEIDAECENMYYVSEIYNNNSNYTYLYIINNTLHYSLLAKLPFNSTSATASNIGYMYKKTNYSIRTGSNSGGNLNTGGLSPVSDNSFDNTEYLYSDSIQYNNETYVYDLVDPKTKSEIGNITGKYTCKRNNASSCYYPYYVIGSDSNYSGYYFNMELEKDIQDTYYYFTYGSSFVENDDGTYTINDYTVVHYTEFPYMRRSTYLKYLCPHNKNGTCSDLLYVIGERSTNISALQVYKRNTYSDSYIYQDGVYKLTGNMVTVWNYTDQNVLDQIGTKHYTCENGGTECETLKYMLTIYKGSEMILMPGYDKSLNPYADSINLTGGIGIEDVLSDWNYGNDINQEDSISKSVVENWYHDELLEFDSSIEDTIYCNDRKIIDAHGWDPDNNVTSSTIINYIAQNKTNDLRCERVTDRFSTKNNLAKLNYKIGLATAEELELFNNYSTRAGSSESFTMTPSYDGINAKVTNSGTISYGTNSYTSYVTNSSGIRPVISLSQGVEYSTGDGTMEHPYKIKSTYKVSVEIKNETEDININIEDMTHVEEGEQVTFKLTPIKGFKVTTIRILDTNNVDVSYNTGSSGYTFTMPSTDVTIIPTYERVSNAVNVEDNPNTKEIKIEVNDASVVLYEDTVRFKVEPKEGYEVDTIEIRDEENNKIDYRNTETVNEYEFTMPDTDVLIKPTYKPLGSSNASNEISNPKTMDSDQSIISFLIFIIFLCISAYIYGKKKSYNL